MTRHRTLLAYGLLGLLPAAAPAQETSGVALHGFVSQGYLQSTRNNYLSVPTEDGSFAFTETALNFSVQPSQRLRIAGQLFARDLGRAGNNQVTIDWALGDYRLNDWLGIRAGRVKLPSGLYGSLLDVDAARPEVLQPTGIYPLSTRDITSSFQGAEIYGTIRAGAGGEISYEAWVGTEDIDDVYIVNRFLTEGANAGLPALRLTNGRVVVSDVRATMDHIAGGSLEWRPPIAGLRLRAAGFTSRSNFSATATYAGFQGPIPVSIATGSETKYDQKHQLFFSIEYQRGGLRASAESYQAKTTISSTVSGLPFPLPAVEETQRPLSCYGQLAYRFNDVFQLSGYYSFLYTDKDDKAGARYTAQGQPDHRAWLKQWTFSGRADVTRHWLLKAEVSRIDGSAGLSPYENLEGLERHWTLVALKTTLHF